jgi:formylglycine-generating enzyme required for sulfatase activity
MRAPLFLLIFLAACGSKRASTPDAAASIAHANTAASVAPGGARPQRPEDCPADMVFIPGGTFTMGLGKEYQERFHNVDQSAPRHLVTLTKPYCIDKLEVSARKYNACIEAGGCPKEANQCNGDYEKYLDHPANCITWLHADAYCTWAGKRLPTEAEWEFAARGPRSFRHPWGNDKPDDTKLWHSATRLRGLHNAPVGSHPAGASPFGVLDMEGNVSEYVADWYAPLPAGPTVDPLGPPAGRERLVKGTAQDSGVLYESDLGERWPTRPDEIGGTVTGFRCAK